MNLFWFIIFNLFMSSEEKKGTTTIRIIPRQKSDSQPSTEQLELLIGSLKEIKH